MDRRRAGSVRGALLVLINACLVVSLGAAAVWVRDELDQRTRENQRLVSQLAFAKHERDRASSESSLRFKQLSDTAQASIRSLESRIDASERRRANQSEAQALGLKRVAADEAQERALAIGSLRRRLDDLDLRLGDRVDRIRSDIRREQAAFHDIQERWDDSIFLIHSRFTYKTREADGTESEHIGTGWGTGFVATVNGHLITNKHVVHPWKFDPELAAMESLGEVEILKDSLVVAAWRSGHRCMTAAGDPDLAVGFNTELGNLTVAASADDSMVTKTTEIAGTTLRYRVHDLDDNDLVVIALDSEETFEPLPCSTFSKGAPVRKLDRVMTLGFPRGQRGLESEHAVTSPSLGTVRKVENTIHITASIIPGNSGGPLFNADGVVVGIATRIYSETLGICLKFDHAAKLLAAVPGAVVKAAVVEK